MCIRDRNNNNNNNNKYNKNNNNLCNAKGLMNEERMYCTRRRYVVIMKSPKRQALPPLVTKDACLFNGLHATVAFY